MSVLGAPNARASLSSSAANPARFDVCQYSDDDTIQDRQHKRSTGEGLFVGTDGQGGISDISRYTDWDTDWDLIVPGSWGRGSRTGLLFYKRSTGEGLFVGSDRQGGITEVRRHTDWDQDWDVIVPLKPRGVVGGDLIGGFTALLFYKRSTGEAMVTEASADGNLTVHAQFTDWDQDWKLIVPGRFGRAHSLNDLLLYK